MSSNSNAGFVRQSKKFEGNPLNDMPEMFEAALDEFSENAFDEASLNNIIKAAGLSKGSFYYRFSDKTDLYLCLLDKISKSKMHYLTGKASAAEFPEDFFEQFRYLYSMGVEYAVKEPRLNKLWKKFLSEKPKIKDIVKAAFPIGDFDFLETLISRAYEKKQFDERLSKDFIKGIIGLVLENADALIPEEITQDEIKKLADELVIFLKSGMAVKTNV